MGTWFSELQKLTPTVSTNQHDAHKHAKVAILIARKEPEQITAHAG